MIRIGICDDEECYHIQLSKRVKSFFLMNKKENVEFFHFQNGKELVETPPELDILFLDMEMPGMHGKDAGRIMKERYPDLCVFVVTSYIEYLDDAMRFHIFRYLSKPLDEKRLYRNLEDAYSEYIKVQKKRRANALLLEYGLRTEDICMIESDGHYTIIHANGERIKSNRQMKCWEERLLASGFYRVHKGYLINMDYVQRMNATEIELRGGEKAFLSRRYANGYRSEFLRYLNSKN